MGTGPKASRWQGGVKIGSKGYRLIMTPEHPNADGQGYVREHVLVAEKALGKYLPRKARVHHQDEDPTNNTPSNLVICENDKYHKLLHVRLRAYRATGNPNSRKCVICGKWDVPGTGDMIWKSTARRINSAGQANHRHCYRKYNRERYRSSHILTRRSPKHVLAEEAADHSVTGRTSSLKP